MERSEAERNEAQRSGALRSERVSERVALFNDAVFSIIDHSVLRGMVKTERRGVFLNSRARGERRTGSHQIYSENCQNTVEVIFDFGCLRPLSRNSCRLRHMKCKWS